MTQFKNNEKPARAAGWLMLLGLLSAPSVLACSSDESTQGDDALTDDDAADDDVADDDLADDDLVGDDDDSADDDTSDDDSADDDAADDDTADDDSADDDAADDDDASDDDAADDDTSDDDAADDDTSDDDAADDDTIDAGADDDAADDDVGDDDTADDDIGDGDAGADPDDDVPPTDVWAECPASDSWNADAAWPLTLAVSEDAVYCATFNEIRTLQEELASKVQLRVTPGEYALPEGEEVAAALPLCMRDADDTITTLTSGTVRTEMTSLDDTFNYSLFLGGVFNDEAASTLQASISHTGTGEPDPTFLFDGKQPDPYDGFQDLMVCQDPEYCFPSLLFTSCGYEIGAPNLHRVELETGNIEFELRLGDSFAGTEPGAYVRASGSFAGQEFTQTNYFKLIYHPTHHHFERTFAVLFDEPIDGVCGVEVTNLERFGDDIADEAYTVDCELNRLDTVTVLGAELVLE